MRRKAIRVKDKMQRDYAYELVARVGRDFAEGFEPERTHPVMAADEAG